MSYTDPTGYFFKSLFKAIGKFFSKVFKAIGRALKKILRNPIVRAILQIVACGGPWAAIACAPVAAGVTAASGGSIGDILQAAIFSFVMPSVWGAVAKATNTLSIIGKALVHGVVNGAVTAARGGRFLAGFVSGVIGKVAGFASQSLFGPAGSDNGMFFARTAVAAAGGCAGALIAKGSCANGAITAAFAHMYNAEGAAGRIRARWINSRISVTKSVDGKWHSYTISGRICSSATTGCNEALADQVFAHVNRNDVPFSNNDLGSGFKNLIDGLIRPFGNQPIDHEEDPANRTSTNITREGHNFHPGTVTHSVQFQNGALYYNVIGTGSGSFTRFNNAAGVPLFRPGVYDAVNKFGK